MNARAELIETPQQAARRLAAHKIREGYRPEGLHEYRSADGAPLYWRIRCKHPGTGDKWIRPMRWNGTGYEIGEPEFPNGKPLYRLPELLAAPADARMFVVEGEPCAEALAELGIIATTSGGKSSADAADWTPARARDVTHWPDNDKPGAEYADAVTAKLRGVARSVAVVDVGALHLPDKGDCVDWLHAHPDATAADVEALATVAPIAPAGHAPEPLRRPTPLPEPYPVAELGPIIRPACESLRRVIKAPDAVCAASLLAAASLATQGLANVEMHGRSMPLSLWLLTIAESGERKSAVDREAMRGVREAERALEKAHAAAFELYEAELEQWTAQRDAIKGAAKRGKGEGLPRLATSLRELGPPPPAPLLPFLTVQDFTAEGLAKLLRDGRPSIGAFTDEGGLVFGGHGMTQETVTRTAATLSKLWDSGDLDRVRAGDGAMKLHGRRLALHLLVQPVIAERALSDAILSGQGFLARCLLAWPEGTAGTRDYAAESLRDDEAMRQFAARTRELLEREPPLAVGTRNELAPRVLPLAPDAAAAWIEAYNAIEHAEAPGKALALCKTWASKAAEQALRIAGVLTLISDPDAPQIEAATIRSAMELALWYLNEAARLVGTAELSPEVRDAEALLNWCHETGREFLYSGDALRKGPSRIREARTFGDAAKELERRGWALPVEGGMILDGRRRRDVWRVLPASAGGEP